MLFDSILPTEELFSKLESVLSNPAAVLSTKFMCYSKSFVVISTILAAFSPGVVVQLPPFTWTLRAHYRVSNWPNFNIGVSQGIRRPKERQREAGEWPVDGPVRTHTTFISEVCSPMWAQFVVTDHHNKYNNEKVWNIARITKVWQTQSEQMLLGK